MKKTLLFLVAASFAFAMNAEIVVKTAAEVCNYLDIQAEAAVLTAVAPTSTTSVSSENGSEFWGYLKSDETEAAMQWNSKDNYNTSIVMPELAGTLDTLVVGTMYRAASGGNIKLGAFKTTAAGKIKVYFQPNGDSARGVKITCGKSEATKEGSGVKIGTIRPGYAAELEIPAGTYAAGDVVITVVTNTCNVFGVAIENLSTGTSSVSNPLADVVYFNGSEILNTEGLNIQMYNALGKLVRTSNATSINVSDLQNGIYIVRAEGLKGALKISK